MKNIFTKIRSSELLNVSFFTAISTTIRLLTSFVSAKIIAIYLGPVGLGMLGQLSSFVSIILVLSTGAVSNGVIKYVSEHRDNEIKQQQVIKASLIITILCSFLTGIIIIIFSRYWSQMLFGEREKYFSIILFFGFTLIFYSIYNLSISVLNGLKEYKKYNYLGISSSIIGLIFSVSLIKFYGIYGALLSVVTYQSIVFILLILFISNVKQLKLNNLFRVSTFKKDYYNLSKFSLMAIVSTATIPVSQIFIRNYLGSNLDKEIVGYYEGINRISMLYLGIITTTLSVYYLPKLSEIKDQFLLRKEIFKGYKLILSITSIILLLVFLLKSIVIRIIFTSSFQPMEAYFFPQLIGDFFKISSWLLAFQMLAKAMTKEYIITEVVFSFSLVLFSIAFIKIYGGIGAMYAYALNYFLYLICMAYIFRKLIFNFRK